MPRVKIRGIGLVSVASKLLVDIYIYIGHYLVLTKGVYLRMRPEANTVGDLLTKSPFSGR